MAWSEFWGAEREGDPMSLRDEWENGEELAAELMSVEHDADDRPDEVALMHRPMQHYDEILWLRGYRAARVVVCSFPAREALIFGELAELPGVVTSTPVGTADAETPERFHKRFDRIVRSYEKTDWVRKDHTVSHGEAS